MNAKKIDFIICYNDELYINECMRYISRLNVPDGMEMDIIGVTEAESMAAGYNAAMNTSNAKYKVYMHQDVFILNQNFISNVVELFERHPDYGMLGVIGSTEKIENANYWNGWNVGMAYVNTGVSAQLVKKAIVEEEKEVIPVIAIDGMLMITQYDVPWREDVFDAFDFYDISQSVEFYKAGYKVGVAHQKEVWCNHDCGPSQLQKYDFYRERFCEEYVTEGYKFQEVSYNKTRSKGSLECAEVVRYVCDMLNQGNMTAAKEVISGLDNIEILEKNMGVIYRIFEIKRIEEQCGIKNSLYKEWMSAEELLNIFRRYWFFVRRVENDFSDYMQDEEWKELVSRTEEIVDIPMIAEGACLDAATTVKKLTETILKRNAIEKPFVSVVMASYNHAQYIGKAIESVLNQTYTNFEFIIVDDASEDESVEVIRQYKDPRIKAIALEENTGFGAGEKGYKMARGEYIAMIASDDMWKPNLLEEEIRFLEEHKEYLCCFCTPELIDENDMTISDIKMENIFRNQNRTREAWFKKLYKEGNCICAPSVCMRKEVRERLGVMRYQYRQLQDFEYWLRVIQIGNIYIHPEKLAYYRKHYNDTNQNISAPTEEVLARDALERKYIMLDIMENMEDEFFFNVFRDEFVFQPYDKEFYLDCEKFVVMLHSQAATIQGAIFFYFNHYKDETFKYHIENYYQVHRKDIWALTGTKGV